MIKKRKMILLVASFLFILCGILGITYAFWKVVKEQKNENQIETACLKIDLKNESEEIDLANLYPTSDEDGILLEPYSATIKNECDIPVKYNVVLDKLIVGNDYNTINSKNIRICYGIDDCSIRNFNEYTLIENSNNALESRVIDVGIITAKGQKDFAIKMWLSKNAEITEQSKYFSSKISVNGLSDLILPSNYGTLYTSVNISKTNNDYVFAEYYENGTLRISGLGEMRDMAILVDNEVDDVYESLYSLLYQSEYKERYEYNNRFSLNRYEFINSLLYKRNTSTNIQNYIENIDNYMTNYNVNEEQAYLDLYNVSKSEVEEIIANIEKFPVLKNIVIDNGIANIGDYLFYSITEGTDQVSNIKVILPDTINSIGEKSFMSTNFEVSLNVGLKEIKPYAFMFSCGLENIEIPDTVESIGQYAFSDVAYLKEIIIPENLTYLDGTTFETLFYKPKLKIKGPQHAFTYSNYQLNLDEYEVTWNYK